MIQRSDISVPFNSGEDGRSSHCRRRAEPRGRVAPLARPKSFTGGAPQIDTLIELQLTRGSSENTRSGFAHLGMRELILWRIVDLFTKLHGRGPRPAWIEKHATAECEEINLSVGDDVFSLLRFRYEADRHCRNTGLAADALGEPDSRDQLSIAVRAPSRRLTR